MKELVIARTFAISLLMLFFSCTSEYHLRNGEEDAMFEDVSQDPAGSETGSSPDADSSNPIPNSEEDPDAGYVTYYRDVEPLLKQLCVACHNATYHEDGIDLSTYKLAKSQVNKIIESMQKEEGEEIMPPDGQASDEVIQTFVYWKVDGLREGSQDSTFLGSPDGTYTYTSDIKALVDLECIACHGATNPAVGFDISTYDKTVSQIDQILARIDLQTGQMGVMPVAGRMAEEKIQAFKDWKDQGMPQ